MPWHVYVGQRTSLSALTWVLVVIFVQVVTQCGPLHQTLSAQYFEPRKRMEAVTDPPASGLLTQFPRSIVCTRFGESQPKVLKGEKGQNRSVSGPPYICTEYH